MIAWTICRPQHCLKISTLSGQRHVCKSNRHWVVVLCQASVLECLDSDCCSLVRQTTLFAVVVLLSNYCDRRKSAQSEYRIRHKPKIKATTTANKKIIIFANSWEVTKEEEQRRHGTFRKYIIRKFWLQSTWFC